jgi:cobalt-zinc-cadmium efflux system protein
MQVNAYAPRGRAPRARLPRGGRFPPAPGRLKEDSVGHTHAHSHNPGTGRVLRWSLVATCVFAAVEVGAGIEAHSLALLSDAGHNFTDGLALLLAWLGFYLEARPADEVKTYGYQRAGVLCAFINAVTLVGLSLWIFYESVLRWRNPEPVSEVTMLWVASLGIVLNAGIMWALRHASRGDLNIRSAFIHMLGDAVGSAAIVVGAIVIRFTGWQRLDPLLSVLIGVLIVWSAWGIIRESLNILLEGLPHGMRLADVRHEMSRVEGVLGIHDLHIWSLGSSTRALSCHVLIEDVPPSVSEAILARLNALLASRFQIFHTTIQFEHAGCEIAKNGCAIPSHACHDEHGH